MELENYFFFKEREDCALERIHDLRELFTATELRDFDLSYYEKFSNSKTYSERELDYLRACILSNGYYETQDWVLDLRSELFDEVGDLRYLVSCENTGVVNKYGFYEYLINDVDLKSQLWGYKDKSLKYVSEVEGGLVISTTKDMFDNFVGMLNELGISYSLEDLKSNMFFDNSVSTKYELPDLSNLRFTPYDFQLDDIKTLLTKKRAIIGHEMGVGKSFISAVVGESLPGKKLVICPESLRINWSREIENVNPEAIIEIKEAKDDFSEGLEADWTIIGYLTAAKQEKYLTPDVLFVDEAHFIKAVNNWGAPTSNRAKAVLSIGERAEFVYALTGTPIPSSNIDAYNLLKLVKSEDFDFNVKNSFYKFAERYCAPKTTKWGKDFSGNSNSLELHNILGKIMIRRLKKEVLSHLKKQRQFLPIRPKLTQEYKDVEQRLYKPKGPEDNYLALAMTGRRLLSTLKINAAKELAETILNNGESVVIVTNFVEAGDRLKEIFKKEACEIRGGLSDKQKQKSIDDFQSGKKKVCILNMVSGGVGVTLTKAHHLIMLDYDWTPANNIQTEDRICRTGQTELSMIYYIYCENSIFDKVFVNMLSDKSYNISKTVDNEDNQFNLRRERYENATYLELLTEEIKKNKVEVKTKKKKATAKEDVPF